MGQVGTIALTERKDRCSETSLDATEKTNQAGLPPWLVPESGYILSRQLNVTGQTINDKRIVSGPFLNESTTNQLTPVYDNHIPRSLNHPILVSNTRHLGKKLGYSLTGISYIPDVFSGIELAILGAQNQ